MKKNIFIITICISLLLNIFLIYALLEFNNEINEKNNIISANNELLEDVEEVEIINEYKSARATYLISRTETANNWRDADKYLSKMQYFICKYDLCKEYEQGLEGNLIEKGILFD